MATFHLLLGYNCLYKILSNYYFNLDKSKALSENIIVVRKVKKTHFEAIS